MRKDFDKILVERPRVGHGMKYGHTRKKFYNSHLPNNVGMIKGHKAFGRDWKELNENLSPLKRFLEGKVGSIWNDVYSEIRQMMGKNPNAVKGHILQHIFQYVELHTHIIKNKRYYDVTYRRLNELDNEQLYVDEQGILCKYKRKVPKKKPYWQLQKEREMLNARYLPDGTHARKINGVWYKVTLFQIKGKDIYTRVETFLDGIKKTSSYVEVNDIFGIHGKPENFVEAYGSMVYAAAKMAMSSRELRKYELQNDL